MYLIRKTKSMIKGIFLEELIIPNSRLRNFTMKGIDETGNKLLFK